MHPTPRVSIIMNCFNSATYLSETLQSALSQSMKDFEIIFWDNQSTDASASIVKSFQDSRIQYFYAPKHTSLGEARNLAAQKARGEWIAFLDCDDLWAPNKLELQLKRLDSDGDAANVGIIYARTAVLGGPRDGQELVLSRMGSPLPEGRVLKALLLEDNFIPLVSALVRTEAYWAAGGIPSSYKQAEDFYIFAAVASEWRVLAEQTICCQYRIHANNYSRLQKTLAYEETRQVIEKFWPKVDDPQVMRDRMLKIMKILDVKAGVSLIRLEKLFFPGIWRILRNGPVFSLRLFCASFLQRNQLF